MWRQIEQARFEEYGDIKGGVDEFNEKDHEEKCENFYLPLLANSASVVLFFYQSYHFNKVLL